MATAKKEKVSKAKKEISTLPKEKQRRLKVYSKIIYCLTRICRAFVIISMIGLAIAMIATPVLVKNIKIKDGTVEVYGNKVTYEEKDGKIELSVKETPIGTLTDKEKESFDYIIKELEKTNMSKTFAYAEVAIALGLCSMFVLYSILKRIDKLFTNIYEFDTPFNEANLEHLRKITYLSLVLLIVDFVADIFAQATIGGDNFSVSLVSVATIMVLYVITVIFEYACTLQKESKATIYTQASE